jgi:hypothetical protein
MKKLFTIAATLLSGLFIATGAQAQTATTSDQVQVTLEFKDVMSLSVNGSQNEVLLSYQTMEDYLQGVESKQTEHLTVFSINPFQVKVAAQGDNQFGTSDIETEAVQVEAVGFTNVTGVTEQNAVNVGATAQTIFKSNNYSNGGTVDINYSTKASPGLKGQAVGKHVGQSYTKTFIYSIETL